MRDRLHLPPLQLPAEPAEHVQGRARGRIRMIGAILLGCMAVTAVRGVMLALTPGDRTVRAAAVQRWDQVTLQARRGEILDRNGHRLATSVAISRFTAPLRNFFMTRSRCSCDRPPCSDSGL